MTATPPTRVVFVLHALGIGGTELNMARLAERFDPARVHVSIAVFGEGPLRARLEAAGIAIHVFPLSSLWGVSMLREGLRFIRFLRAEKVDIVHAHDRYSNVFAAAWGSLGGARVITSKRWGRMSRVHAVGNRVAFRLSDRVLANSGWVGRSLVSEDGVAARRIIVVPNFVDADAFLAPSVSALEALRSAAGVPSGSLVVGMVARLHPVKDHHTLFRAVSALRAEFPALVLLVIGDGPSRPALEQFVAAEGLRDVVRFTGELQPPPNLHCLLDVSVLCSFSEGFPNTIVEAMAASRPVVATSVGGVPDAVREGVNGALVPVGDHAALAAALAPLLRSAGLRHRLGEAGRKIARDEFSPSAVFPRLLGLYDELLGRRSA